MFALIDYPSLVAQMVARLRAVAPGLTDFTEGAVARALLEALAAEVQRQNYGAYVGIREGIEVGTYRNFEFARLPATYASGSVRFTRTATGAAVSVPAGTRVRVPGSGLRIYATAAEGTMAVGIAAVDVAVTAQAAGAAGNTPAATVVEIVDPPLFSATVTNPQPFLNGLDQESDEDRRARFRLYIAGLSRGTRQAIEFAARSVMLTDSDGNVQERVTGAYVHEPWQDDPRGFIGLVEVYVDNGAGTASQALLDAVRATLLGTQTLAGAITPGWVAAGIDLDVFSVAAVTQDVTATVTVAASYDEAAVLADVEAAITAYLGGIPVFRPLIFAELVAATMAVDGVVDVSFAAPTANVAAAFDERIAPGTITVTAATA